MVGARAEQLGHPSACLKGIEVEGLIARVAGFTLGPIDMVVPPGSVFAIVGPNGSGKTTLLRAVSGLIRAKGRIRVCGTERSLMVPGLQDSIEYVPAEPQADPYAKVEEILEASNIILQPVLGTGIVKAITPLLGKRMGSLSSGQRRLVCLTRGLLSHRPLLLVDEPFTHLDVAVQSLIARALRLRAQNGAIVIIALHELHWVARVADTVLLLHRGRPVLRGGPNVLAASIEIVSRIYGAPLEVVQTQEGPIILPRPLRASGD